MAVDGTDAVMKYKQQPFSLLLLDVQMPKTDGIQAANGSSRSVPLRPVPTAQIHLKPL